GPYQFFRRIVAWPLARLIYRQRVLHGESIPSSGPILFCSNHVSQFDWLMLIAALKRPLRFVVSKARTQSFLGPFLRLGRIVTLDDSSAAAREQSVGAAGEALRAGEALAFFPERRMTQNGYLQPFDPTCEQMAQRSGARIIPVYLDELWGTMSSLFGGPA